jgi:WD40 repeat protein
MQHRDPERYQILGEHGRGGLGRVSRAHDHDLGRDIAIKELLSRGHVSEARFLREALITARLEHPGIVPIYEAGRWPDGTPFYAMKLVAGRSLRELIVERTTVEQRIGLLHHVIAVADALAYAHGRNIIHRDLKPANVIVGDFGETIVIDWGLAKDLTIAEPSTVGGGPFRANLDDGLTSAGSVLGTPAYMAPEQERGEPVDQRADVFAIGAMLWELCSLQRVPPTERDLRHRLLRRAGIDQDLVTIIDKALDPDPVRRYTDAGALAADLKAFKSGARIAARSYSLFAMLAHWTRRHLALAVSALGLLVLGLTGAVIYIHDVASERDRADVSEERARHARVSAEDSLDALTLKHAQLLLTTDPSAAIDALSTYQGSRADRANQIRAEAKGRGVAALRATPHSSNIRWAEGTPDGTIVSLSTDGTITRTARDGSSVILSRGVASSAKMDYSPERHLLAYACDPSALCFYDILRNSRFAVAPIFREAHPVGISFGRNGTALAMMSRDGVLRVIDVTTPDNPTIRLIKKVDNGSDLVFFRDDVVVAGSVKSIEFVHSDGNSESFGFPNTSYWDTDASKKRFAVATIDGHAFIFEGSRIHVAVRARLCQGPVIGLQFMPTGQRIVYGCRDGTIGFWDLQHNVASVRIRIEGHADLIRVDPTGIYVAVAGANGIVTLLDLNTELVTSYKGHASRLTAIAPPTPTYPLAISADVTGSIRAWALPDRIVNVGATLNSQFHTAVFDKRTTSVVATTFLPMLTTYSPSARTRTLGPHAPYALSLVRSSTGKNFAAYGLTELVEIWSFASMTRTRLLNTKQGSVSQLSFVDDSDDIVTAGHDGRLVRWTPDGKNTTLAQIDQAIGGFVLLPSGNSAVFSGIDGSLWRTAPGGDPVLLRAARARVTVIITSPEQKSIIAGYADGDVIAIDPVTWRSETILHASGAVREISVTPETRWMVVATNDGLVHVGTRLDGASPFEKMSWLDLVVRARHQVLTSDGLLVAVSTDGTIWLYSIPRQQWLCVPIMSADMRWVAIAEDTSAAAALDVEGRLFWVDLNMSRNILSSIKY